MSWTNQQKSVLTIVALTSFLNPFLSSSVNLALPAIEESFNMNAISLSWVVTAYLLSSAMLLLPLGKWGDLAGIKKIFKIGVLIFSLTTFLCGLAPNGSTLLAFRFIQGIGGAMVMSTGPAILVSMFPPKHRGRVLGISVASVYLGLAMGPFFGGMLTEHFNWRFVFLVPAVLGFFASIITFVYLGKDAVVTDNPKRVKLTGSLIYAISLVAMIIGSSSIPSVSGWLLLIAGIALIFVFFIVESRSPFPVIDMELFSKNRLFAFSNLAALINYSATFALVFLLSLYLQQIKDFSPQQSGFILLAQPVLMTIFAPIFGRLSDRVQPRILASLGMALCTIGLALLSFIGKDTPVNTIIALLVLRGMGFSLFSSPNMNTIMGSVGKDQYGLASGISATMRIVGQMVSMTIVTLFFALNFGSSRVEEVSDPVFLHSMSVSFLVFSAICAVGIWFSLARGDLKRD